MSLRFLGEAETSGEEGKWEALGARPISRKIGWVTPQVSETPKWRVGGLEPRTCEGVPHPHL